MPVVKRDVYRDHVIYIHTRGIGYAAKIYTTDGTYVTTITRSNATITQITHTAQTWIDNDLGPMRNFPTAC